MKWLDEPKTPGERALREGLDRAVARTGDELTLRRLWGRVAEPDQTPRSRRARWLWLAGGLGLLATAGAAGFVVLDPAPARVPVVAAVKRGPLPAAPAVVAAKPEPAVLTGPASVRTGPRQERRVHLKGGATAAVAADSVLIVDAGHRPVVQRGRVTLEVAKQPPGERFTVGAGPYVIVVVGTRFDVEVGRERVGVNVDEGMVEVWRDRDVVRLQAGQAWSGRLQARVAPTARRSRPFSAVPARRQVASSPSLSLSSSRPVAALPAPAPAAPPVSAPLIASPPPPPPAPPPLRPMDLVKQAKDAASDGEPDRALAIYASVAQGRGAAAEVAAYERAALLRTQLLRPREAVKAWQQYRARFPNGLLRIEADISIIETLVSIGDEEAALAEAEAFQRRHPDSERHAEMIRLAERLRRQLAGGR